MFAQINTESIQTIGLGQLNTAHDGFLTTAQITKLDLPEQWPDIRQFWQTTLTTITEEFLHGDCSYQLSSPSQQRFYQHLEPLLRGAEEDEIIQALPGKPEFNQ